MLIEEVDALLTQTREQVLQKQFDTNDSERLRQMVECMGDSRGMVRLGFAETLGLVGKPAVPFLVEALQNHDDPVVRRASAKTLTLIADPNCVDVLVEALLNDEDTVVKSSSVGALARIGEASVPVLLEILKSPETTESTKGHAAWALAFIGSDAKEHLYREVNSESESVRSAVVGAIAKIAQDNEEEADYTLLVNALADSSENVRCEAAAVLGNLGYRLAVPSLIKLLEHPSDETRKSAALSLMKIKDMSAIEPLKTQLAKDKSTDIHPILQLAINQLQKASETQDEL